MSMEKGNKKEKCSRDIMKGDIRSIFQCLKNAVIQREGKHYCKVHDPEYIKVKEKERDEKYRKMVKWNTCSCGYYSDSFSLFNFCPLCGKEIQESK